MTINDCKNNILYALDLGMDLRQAIKKEDLSPAQKKELLSDKKFLREAKLRAIYLELDYLEMYDKAARLAAAKGNTKALEFMLKSINPDRWGDKKPDQASQGVLILTKDDEKLL